MFEKKFLLTLLCLVVALSLSATATKGADILFVSSMTEAGDDVIKAFLEGLGHTVTYIDDDEDEATTEAAAAAADLVFISESVGSGGIKNEITEVEVPMIIGEPWAWDEMGLTEGGGGDEVPVTTDVEIVDPEHPLAGGLSGTVAVLTDLVEGCNLGKGVTGPEATVIATATLSDGVTYDVIFVYEKGAALPVAPADGSPQVAADIRIGMGFHANCTPVLSENASVLLGAAVEYALGLTGPPEPVNPGTDGLVASYTLDGDALDSSGNGHDGTTVGEPVFVEGQVGMALDFDGIDDLVELGKFDVVGQITLAAWIKADDFEINDARIITKANEWGGNDHWWMLSTISETSLRFRLKTDDGQDTTTLISDPVLEAGVWAHVAASWDGSMMRIYKDGVEVASQEKGGTAVAVDPDVSAAIGSQPSDAFASDPARVIKFFDGLIDEVRIYDRALSEGELLYLAGARATPVDPGTDGLAAYYPLENDVLDASVNSNDGTIVGAPTFIEGLAGNGMAMEFHGLGAPGGGGDYIDCGNDASLDITGPISLALWIKPGADDPEGQGTETAPMAKAMDGVGWSWQVRYGWGSPQPYMAFTFNTSPRAWAYVGKNLEKDEWVHIACSHDGETLKCYLDGDETDSTPMGQITSSEAPVLIGSDGWGCDWIGGIDEVAIYNRDLSVGEIRYLAGFRAPVDPGTENLVAYYPFDNDANDASGNNNHGTLSGDPVFVEGPAGYGMALQFDGVDDHVDCGNDLSLDITGPITIGAWVYPTGGGSSDYPRIVDKSDGTGGADPGYKMYLRVADNYLVTLSGGGVFLNSSSSANLNEWNYVVFVTDGTQRKLFLNGAWEVWEESALPLSSSNPLYIGNSPAGARPFEGIIDEVVIYNRALSEPEVRFLAGEK